jgi:hypothetical protein
MPLKQLSKRKSEDATAVVTDTNDSFRKAALFKIDSQGNILKNKAGVFLLNPATYEDSKSANWAQQQVPGQSDPILQWVSSSARTVSFEALVTNDTADFDDGIIRVSSENDEGGINNIISQVGKIASAFFKVSVPPTRQTAQIKATKGDALDISYYLNYYRSLLYPTYDNQINPRKLQQNPPLLVLYAGSSVPKIKYENRISSQHDLWVLTDLRIRVTKQLPNLAPMEALVQFTLVQYNVRSFDTRRFTG